MARKLHLGCSLKTPEGWLNLDGSWNAWLSKYSLIHKLLRLLHIVPSDCIQSWDPNIFIHDVRKPLPFRSGSFSTIYASHLLEHLYLEEGKSLLKECFRLLEPNGVLRMVVPDLKVIVLKYIGDELIDNNGNMSRADWLNLELGLRKPHPPTGNIIYKLYTILKDFNSHKWMYDADSLIGHFKQAGFEEVKEMALHQSRIEGIEQIEVPVRVLNGEGIIVEGIKPGS